MGSPEHVGRLRGITRALRNDAELLMCAWTTVRDGTPRRGNFALAHDAGYIASVRAMAGGGGGRIDADTVVSEGSQDAASAGAGVRARGYRPRRRRIAPELLRGVCRRDIMR